MSKQVLIEYFSFTPSPRALQEARLSPSKNLIVTGVVQRAEAKNQNGRVYPKETLEREVEKYIGGPITENRALGELDHPESMVINLKNVSHNIKKIFWEQDNVMGVIEILPTPSGNILKSLFENGIPVGVSSRGMGSLKQMGELMEVQDDFELLCWDFVSTPSNPGSYMQLVKEGKEIPTNSYIKVNSINLFLFSSKESDFVSPKYPFLPPAK